MISDENEVHEAYMIVDYVEYICATTSGVEMIILRLYSK